jgi:hypothetical protein
MVMVMVMVTLIARSMITIMIMIAIVMVMMVMMVWCMMHGGGSDPLHPATVCMHREECGQGHPRRATVWEGLCVVSRQCVCVYCILIKIKQVSFLHI